jgi:DNA polymerase III subunit delta'
MTSAPAAVSAAAPAWLAGATEALAAAHRSGRLPHALLIHEAAGAGGDWLAAWAARLVLCRNSAAAPCGECRSCRRVMALEHPDLLWIRPPEDSRQIRIEQLRELTAELALTSHGGGYKVAVIAPADALNRFAANALLKTLEEPPARTLLVLVATQPSRLPPTIVSRCQRLRVRSPGRAAAVAWLTATRGAADWERALDAVGEAPMLLATADPAALVEVATESDRTLEALAAGRTDPVAAAERWARSDLSLRLLRFEKWLTDHVRRGERAGAFLAEVSATPYLPARGAFLNIRELYGLIDEVRELRATLDVPLNRDLALEALFRRLAPAGRTRSEE